MKKDKKSTDFSEKVYQIVKRIPSGKVATYKQIGLLLGNSKLARAVGNALHRNPNPSIIFCYKIVNKEGFLAKNFGGGGQKIQAQRLEKDKIAVQKIKTKKGIRLKVDLNKYLWEKK